jgi:hypothetical protein
VMCFFPMHDMSPGTVEVEKVEELRSWPVHCAWEDLQNDLANLYEKELDEPLLPIGTDGSSNYLCVVLDGIRYCGLRCKDATRCAVKRSLAEQVPQAEAAAILVDCRSRGFTRAAIGRVGNGCPLAAAP